MMKSAVYRCHGGDLTCLILDQQAKPPPENNPFAEPGAPKLNGHYVIEIYNLSKNVDMRDVNDPVRLENRKTKLRREGFKFHFYESPDTGFAAIALPGEW